MFPLWRDPEAKTPNLPSNSPRILARKYKLRRHRRGLSGVPRRSGGQSGLYARFHDDLAQPGLRIPITARPEPFAEPVELGRRVIWLHTFGERLADPKAGRPAGPPRLHEGSSPSISKEGAIPGDAASMPDEIDYDQVQT